MKEVLELRNQIADLRARVEAQRLFIERVIGHCYAQSCHHDPGHTLHCCDFAGLVAAYEAIQDTRYADVEAALDG